jgi:hypothetical protein
LEQHRLYLLHPFRADPIPELHQRSRLQNLTALEGVESAEALPISILMQHFHGTFIRAIITVLQNMDATMFLWVPGTNGAEISTQDK